MQRLLNSKQNEMNCTDNIMDCHTKTRELKRSPVPHAVKIVLKSFQRSVGSITKYAVFAIIVGYLGLIASAEQVALEFDYPANELPGMTFRAYSTNNVAAPVLTWPLLATFVGTNRVMVTLPEGTTISVVQASNSLGTSFFSNMAQAILPRTTPVPRFVKP